MKSTYIFLHSLKSQEGVLSSSSSNPMFSNLFVGPTVTKMSKFILCSGDFLFLGHCMPFGSDLLRQLVDLVAWLALRNLC